MSWYLKDLVTCGKCGRAFSTPIDCHSHRMYCNETKKVFENKSVELREDDSGRGYIKALNPMGKFWIMRTGYYEDPLTKTIVRNKKKYALNKTDKGWVWTEQNNS